MINKDKKYRVCVETGTLRWYYSTRAYPWRKNVWCVIENATLVSFETAQTIVKGVYNEEWPFKDIWFVSIAEVSTS